MKNFYLVNLGCPKNLTDSEELAYNLYKEGYTISQKEESDLVLINTCAFLKSAIRESYQVIKHFVNLKENKKIKKIIVAGCLVEREKEKILKKYPQVDAILGVNSINEIKKALKEKKSYILPASKILETNSRFRLTLPHSAYLKIAEGCDNFCSFCTIPFIKGRLRSKPIEKIYMEALSLVRNKTLEISLIAQETTSYGKDIYGKENLKELLKKLVKIKKLKWLRLMYMYPDIIDEELIKIIKDYSNICHYLEMPFQHFSNDILKRMNRTSSEKIIMEKMELIKKNIPDMAIRTSFIVGFPSETEKDFNKLLKFVKEMKFNNVAIFKYSKEKGTSSYNYENQIDEKEKEYRYNKIMIEQSKIVDEINKNLIGKEFQVLADSLKFARTYMDAPDIDGVVYLEKENFKVGQFNKIKIVEAKGYQRKAILI